MTAVNPETYHESASSIGAMQKCNVLFRLAYREGLRPDKDTDSQRDGNDWHAVHEVYANTLIAADADVVGNVPEFAMGQVLEEINRRFTTIPNGKTPEEWAVARQKLLISFIGYQWYWQNDPVEFLASEVPFNLPVRMPKTGLPLPMNEVQRVGKIDHIIRWQGMVGPLERKSTARSIDHDSDYWDKSKKDTQVSMYAAALREMPPVDGLTAEDRYGNTLYDVWHKPTINPKSLTQADTKAFLETGLYCDQQFTVEYTGTFETGDLVIMVDGDKVGEIEYGKKGSAIRETPGMYGARLLADIYERPTFYFARREIARTDAEIKAFHGKVYSVYQTQKLIEKHGTWYENESACRATFACPYIPICYGPGHAAVCDGKTTPNGFKRIFVDLTVKGQPIDEE